MNSPTRAGEAQSLSEPDIDDFFNDLWDSLVENISTALCCTSDETATHNHNVNLSAEGFFFTSSSSRRNPAFVVGLASLRQLPSATARHTYPRS